MRKHFETFVRPERHASMEEILAEARSTYRGHLEATVLQFRSPNTASEIDKLLGGESSTLMTAKACYDYAIHGKLKPAKTESESEDLSHDWKSLANLILTARYGIEFFSPSVEGESIGVPIYLEQLFFHAILRANLDLDTLPDLDEDMLPSPLRGGNSGFLNLKEVAVLAQMDEKSVRNATQPSAPDRLHTRKAGTRTVVDSKEALRWLKNRRNFEPTTVA